MKDVVAGPSGHAVINVQKLTNFLKRIELFFQNLNIT